MKGLVIAAEIEHHLAAIMTTHRNRGDTGEALAAALLAESPALIRRRRALDEAVETRARARAAEQGIA